MEMTMRPRMSVRAISSSIISAFDTNGLLATAGPLAWGQATGFSLA